jgi:hypothetical protein
VICPEDQYVSELPPLIIKTPPETYENNADDKIAPIVRAMQVEKGTLLVEQK